MTRLTSEQTSSLASYYLLANTPTYLYRRFRESPTVQRLATEATAYQLVQSLLKIDKLKQRNLSDVVTAYALTVALTFLEQRDVSKALRGKKVKNIEWVDRILKLGNQKMVPTARSEVLVKPRIVTSELWTGTMDPRLTSRVEVKPRLTILDESSVSAKSSTTVGSVGGEE